MEAEKIQLIDCGENLTLEALLIHEQHFYAISYVLLAIGVVCLAGYFYMVASVEC